MKTFTAILALSASVAFAAPLVAKRNDPAVVTSIIVEEVYETVFTTTTMYVDPTDMPSSEDIGAFYEQPPPAPTTTPTTAPAYKAPESAYKPPPAAEAPPQAAPVAAPSPAPYVAPAQPSPEPAYVAPAAPAAPASPPPSTGGSGYPSSGGSNGGSGGQGSRSGDMTHYDVSVGLGSCGTTATNSENVVALSYLDMNNGANPNANPLCGKTINIYSDTGVHTARVFDTCPACAKGALDLPEPLFKLIAPNGDGRVKGVTWDFA